MRIRRIAGIVALLLVAVASIAEAQSGGTMLKGGVSESAPQSTIPHVCANSTVFAARIYADQDPKLTKPGCAKERGTDFGCNAPPSWPFPADWKILDRKNGDCLVAQPLIQPDRDRLANRKLITYRQLQAENVWRQCDADPWDTSKVLCDAPPWTPPPRGNVGANGACADGSNGGGPNSTNYYGCFQDPQGPYLGRRPPTGAIATPCVPSSYSRNSVICQNVGQSLSDEQRKMNANQYYTPAANPTPENSGYSSSYTYPASNSGPATSPGPQKLISAVNKGGVWEFTFDNNARWTAPATKSAFVAEYGANYTYGIMPNTVVYRYVTGTVAQPTVNYGVIIRGHTFTVRGILTKMR